MSQLFLVNIGMWSRVFRILESLPITIYVNFRCLPFRKAIRLPLIVDYRTRIKGICRDSIILPDNIRMGMVKIGWGYGSLGTICNNRNMLIINDKGKIYFNGAAQFALGVTLRCDHNGIIEIGNRFRANQNFTCFSNTRVSFGDDIVAGWNVNVRDGDGHYIFDENSNITNSNEEIVIGNHVWLASHCDILKGVVIPDDCIVGFRALVTRKFTESNCILAGVPAKIVKQKINWRY